MKFIKFSEVFTDGRFFFQGEEYTRVGDQHAKDSTGRVKFFSHNWTVAVPTAKFKRNNGILFKVA